MDKHEFKKIMLAKNQKLADIEEDIREIEAQYPDDAEACNPSNAELRSFAYNFTANHMILPNAPGSGLFVD